MKRTFLFITGISFVAILLLLNWAQSQEKKAIESKSKSKTIEESEWEKAQKLNTFEAFQDFIKNYPQSKFIEKAKNDGFYGVFIEVNDVKHKLERSQIDMITVEAYPFGEPKWQFKIIKSNSVRVSRAPNKVIILFPEDTDFRVLRFTYTDLMKLMKIDEILPTMVTATYGRSGKPEGPIDVLFQQSVSWKAGNYAIVHQVREYQLKKGTLPQVWCFELVV